MRTSHWLWLSVLVSSSVFAQNLRVLPVPASQADTTLPHAAYNGRATTFKAIARGGNGTYTFEWDFDGNGVFDVTNTTTNRYDLSASFTYPNQTSDVTFNALVRVTSNGQTVTVRYPVRVYTDVPSNPNNATERQLQVMRDVALDDGLWFLHKQLSRSGNEDDPLVGARGTGIVGGTSATNLATAFTLHTFSRAQRYAAFPAASYLGAMPNAFENDRRWQNDPYAEDAMRLLNFLLTQAQVVSVAASDEVNLTGFYPEVAATPIPGTDDGIGLVVGNSAFDQTLGPLAVTIEALAVGRLAGSVAQVGDANRVLGRRFEFILQQLVDGLVWSQNDAGSYPGAWYYTPNSSNDMLGEFEAGVSGPVHALQTVERFARADGVIVPNFVKARTVTYLLQNQNTCPQGGTGGSYIASYNAGCDFALSATMPFVYGWLGANLAPTTDTRVAFPGYSSLTRGQLRGHYDTSLVFIANVFSSLSPGLNNWDTGFVTGGDFSRTDGLGNYFTMLQWARAARAVQPNVTTFGMNNWSRQFARFIINNQNGANGWLWNLGDTQANTDNYYGATGRATQALLVLLGDAPVPVVSLVTAPTTGVEGATLAFQGLSNVAGTGTWRVNGVVRGLGPTFSWTFADDGAYSVNYELLTAEGLSASATVTVTISNAAPTVDAGADVTVDEGTAVTWTGTVSDPGTADTHTFSWDFGDATTAATTLVATHVWLDNGAFTVTLTGTDDDLSAGSDTATVTVRNVAPTLTSRPTSSATQGTAWTYTLTFTDPGALDTHTCTMPQGPTGAVLTGCAVTWTPSSSPTSADFRLCVTDDDGAATCESFTVNVPLLDTDGDTLPDAWEVATFGDLTHTATEDADADGLTVRDEYLGGTNPTQYDGPSAPTAAMPTCGSTVSSARPTLTVTNATDPQMTPLRYEFEVYEDQALTSLLVVERDVPAGASSTSWRVASALDEDARYFWRARARDTNVFGAWTATCSFTVDATNSRPSAPRLDSPAVGATVSTATVSLVVANATDAEGDTLTYEFEVFLEGVRVANGAAIAAGASTTGFTTPALREDGAFTWRARASDAGGAGPWSEEGRFSINAANSAPRPPVLISPQPGSTVSTLTPTLEFLSLGDADGDAVRFDWEVAADASFSAALSSGSDVTATSVVVSVALSEDTRACWRVRADDGQSTSSWVSSCFRVSVSDDAPNVPTTGNPSNGSVVATLTPVFTWASARDPEGQPVFYELEVSEGGAVVATVTRIGGSAALVPAPLVDGKSYSWRVRSVTDEGPASAFSAASTFEVKLPATPEPVAPAKGCNTAGTMSLLAMLAWFVGRRRR